MSAPCPMFVFSVSIVPRPRADGLEADAVTRQLFSLLDANGLTAERELAACGLKFVISREGTQATQADRELVMSWANRWREMAVIAVGDLSDRHEDA